MFFFDHLVDETLKKKFETIKCILLLTTLIDTE